MRNRAFWIALAFTLCGYPPAELTRIIVHDEFVLHIHPTIPLWQFGAEIALTWACFIIAIVIVAKKVK